MSTWIWASPPACVSLCPLGFRAAEKRKSALLCAKRLGKCRGKIQFTGYHLDPSLILLWSYQHGTWDVKAGERPVRKGTTVLQEM